MEFENRLRDGTNIGMRVPISKTLKPGVPFGNNNNAKDLKRDKENLKHSNIITKNEFKGACAEDQIMDISMLSISGNDSKIVYKLPDSIEITNLPNVNQWSSDMKCRRWNNRLAVCRELSRLERRLKDISFDSVTGERYLMETLDYRVDFEISKLPLGRNFLQNTNVNPNIRTCIIDLLFSTSIALRTDRYIVPMALACVDRYIKVKGKTMLLNDYKNVALSCFFLCCKFDLVYYPSIDDLCDISEIADPKTLINIEVDVLKTLEFFISIPTPIEFLRPLTLLKQRDGVSHNIAKFFLEVSLYVYDLACHPAHIVAASCYCLSMALSFREPSVDATWTDLMKLFTGLDIDDIRPTINILGYAVITTDFQKDMMAVGREHATVIEVLNKRHSDLSRLSSC